VPALWCSDPVKANPTFNVPVSLNPRRPRCPWPLTRAKARSGTSPLLNSRPSVLTFHPPSPLFSQRGGSPESRCPIRQFRLLDLRNRLVTSSYPNPDQQAPAPAAREAALAALVDDLEALVVLVAQVHGPEDLDDPVDPARDPVDLDVPVVLAEDLLCPPADPSIPMPRRAQAVVATSPGRRRTTNAAARSAKPRPWS
jgi:hypothetical protein